MVKIDNFELILDKEDLHFIEFYKWYSTINICGQIYFSTSIEGKSYILHRIIMGNPENFVVDHINGNTLDNRKSNLRICTLVQNLYNQKKHKGKRHSKYKGVTFRKDLRTKPWEAFIYPNRKHIRLGYFSTEVEAAKAYDEAAKKYYGEFARLNFKDN